jgi:hypothetical protein
LSILESGNISKYRICELVFILRKIPKKTLFEIWCFGKLPNTYFLEVFMKLLKKASFVLLLLAVLALPVFGDDFGDIGEVQKALGDLSKIMGETLSANATNGLTWSDAYIGQLIGAPPHFGFGISAGGTIVKLDQFDDIFASFGGDTSDIKNAMGALNFLPVPTGAPELRIGGFLLPFDIGIKALPLPVIENKGTAIKYTMVGADVRYAILQDRGPVPDLSIGLGFSYSTIDLDRDLKGGAIIPLGVLAGHGGFSSSSRLEIDNSKLGFDVKNKTLDLKLQMSKHVLFLTPYLGLGASYGWSTVNYDVKGNAAVTGGGNINDLLPEVNQYLGSHGVSGLDSAGASGIGSSADYNGFDFRVYGGLSFDIAAFRIDLTGVYHSSGHFGANVGVRFQF